MFIHLRFGQAQRHASADSPLRRAGYLPRLVWEQLLTADWYLHLCVDPSDLRRSARVRRALPASLAGIRVLLADRRAEDDGAAGDLAAQRSGK
jgi:hypothetical protein